MDASSTAIPATASTRPPSRNSSRSDFSRFRGHAVKRAAHAASPPPYPPPRAGEGRVGDEVPKRASRQKPREGPQELKGGGNGKDTDRNRPFAIPVQERGDPQPLASRHPDHRMGEAGRRFHRADL